VIGKKVVGGYWRIQSSNGFHNNISQGGMVVPGAIPIEAVELVELVATTLGIDHAGFDVAFVGSHPYLFEFNRIFGTQGVESIIGDLTPIILSYLMTTLDELDPNTPKGPRSQGKRRQARARKVA
jgi:ribosomal protein S6--L-glutamate ligase